VIDQFKEGAGIALTDSFCVRALFQRWLVRAIATIVGRHWCRS